MYVYNIRFEQNKDFSNKDKHMYTLDTQMN